MSVTIGEEEATGSLTLDQLVAFLVSNDNYLITSHADPDGDAIGSELGLVAVLRALGKSASILNSDACPGKLRVFDTSSELRSLEEGAVVPPNLGEKTLILIDTSDFQHTRRAKDALFPFGRQVIIIDHHTPPAQVPCPAYVDDTAAASSQIVFQIAEATGVSLDAATARALFMGIVFDTGSFIYPKTTPETFRAAQKLVALGARPKEIHSELYETIEPSKLRLLIKVQGGMRLVHQDRTAVQVMTQDMLRDCAAVPEDAEHFINYPLKCTSVLVSMFIKEVEPGLFRCSLRSKGTDVSGLAQTFGGGGHRTAAGFPCPSAPLADLETLLLESILELYSKD